MDGGGWSGGEFVLGGSGEKQGAPPSQMLNRREAMAKAAEERMKRQREAGSGDGDASA